MATKTTSPATKTTSPATRTSAKKARPATTSPATRTSAKKARPATTKRGPATKGRQRMPADIAKADAGLRKAAKQLGDAVAELRASEDKAWKDYSDDVHEALLHMNAQLEVATAQVKAAHSETRDDLADALHQAAGARKGIVDQFRVQDAARDDGGTGPQPGGHRQRQRHRPEAGVDHRRGAPRHEEGLGRPLP